MDAEAARQLTDAVENLTNVMYNAGGKLSGLGEAANAAGKSQLSYNKGVISGTEASLSYAESQRKAKVAAKNMADAQDQAKSALNNFVTGLTNTSTEFAKYNSTLKSAGDAAVSLGKNFGLVGLALGGLIKGVTSIAQAATTQADNSLKATDEFNKMGAAGGHTAKSIAEMGIKIGLSNEQFGLMPKALKRAGDSIVSLGANTADGQKKLMGMLAVTNEQREAFQRLGIGQEELMERQSDYVALQRASGMQLVSNMKTEAGLQRASLEYTKNLLVLADITGQDVDSVAAQQKAAQSAYEIQLDNFRIAREIKKAELDTSEEGKKRVEQLKAEKKSRDDTLAIVSSIGDQDLTAGLQKFFSTGAITEQSAMYAQMGIDMQGFRKRMQEGEDISGEFANALRDAVVKKNEEIGTAAAFNKETGKAFGQTEKILSFVAANAETDFKKKKKNAEASTGTPEDKTGKTGKTSEEDPAQIARNKSTTLTIEFNRALETLLLESNPLMSGFNALTIAMTALVAAAGLATIALGALAAKSTLGKISDMTALGGDKKEGAGKYGKLKSVAGGVLKGGALAVGGMALGAGADYAKEKGYEKTGTGLDVAGKTASYAGTGAMIGSVIPGVGTVVGGVVGGLVGAGMGLYENKKQIFGSGSSAPAAAPVAMGNEGNRGAKPTPQPPEGSQDKNASTTTASAVDLSKILKFGTGSGSKENFDGLDSTFKNAVIAAATEYNAVTGNMIMINSAKRASEDQQRLYDETVAAGRPGLGPTGMAVGKPGRSLHEKGQAVDIQNYKDTKAIAAFNKQGLYQKVPNDPVHFQANDGAMISGPSSGYPVKATFHGPEIVAPLNPDSILTKLSKMSVSEMEKSTSTSTISNSTTENIISSNAEMIELMKMFVVKMDDFIDAQSDSNSIQTELLQYSKA